MLFRDMDIRDASPDDVDFIVRRMRAADRREVYGIRGSDSADQLIAEICSALPFYLPIRTFRRAVHPRPIALVSIQPQSPHSGYANMIATDEWPLIARHCTRYIRDVLIPLCIEQGYTRIEARALVDGPYSRQSCHWLIRLGAKLETFIGGFDRHGAVFAQFAWVK